MGEGGRDLPMILPRKSQANDSHVFSMLLYSVTKQYSLFLPKGVTSWIKGEDTD